MSKFRMRNAECGILILALILALFVACSGSGALNKSGSDAVDDDSVDDDTADDDSDDDDSGEPDCAIVWLECEYENPIDQVTTDECGETISSPGSPGDPEWTPYYEQVQCVIGIDRAGQQAIADCGFGGGCNDWVYAWRSCLADLDGALIDCAENPSDMVSYYQCTGLAHETFDCGNI